MKILITGYTSRMCNLRRTIGDYITFSLVLEEILRDMGHEVERRQVRVHEEIAGVYDYAFVGLAPVGSMTSIKVPEAHYVMDSMTNRHCVFADDWSFCSYASSVKSVIKRWDNWLKFKNFPYEYETLERTRQSMQNMLDMQTPGNNAPVLAPTFPWGDHQFLMRINYKANLFTVDPSPWVRYPTIDILPMRLRKTQWVNASLSDHSPWIRRQSFNLPIVHYGNKRLGENTGMITETELIKEFGNSTGVISVGYSSAGSGWWRSRYLNAAWAETPLYCDPRDQTTMGDAYKGSVRNFESEIGTGYWRARAIGQMEWLGGHISKKEDVMDTLTTIMNL